MKKTITVIVAITFLFNICLPSIALAAEYPYEYYMDKFEDAHDDYCRYTYYYYYYYQKYKKKKKSSYKRKKEYYKKLRSNTKNEYKKWWKKLEDAVEDEFGSNSLTLNFLYSYEDTRDDYYSYKKYRGRYKGSRKYSYKKIYKKYYNSYKDSKKAYREAEDRMVNNYKAYNFEMVTVNENAYSDLTQSFSAYFDAYPGVFFEEIQAKKIKIKGTDYTVIVRYDAPGVHNWEPDKVTCKDLEKYEKSPPHLNIEFFYKDKKEANIHVVSEENGIKRGKKCYKLYVWETVQLRGICIEKDICGRLPNIGDITPHLKDSISKAADAGIASAIADYLAQATWYTIAVTGVIIVAGVVTSITFCLLSLDKPEYEIDSGNVAIDIIDKDKVAPAL